LWTKNYWNIYLLLFLFGKLAQPSPLAKCLSHSELFNCLFIMVIFSTSFSVLFVSFVDMMELVWLVPQGMLIYISFPLREPSHPISITFHLMFYGRWISSFFLSFVPATLQPELMWSGGKAGIDDRALKRPTSVITHFC
jgi:hypothetical protein